MCKFKHFMQKNAFGFFLDTLFPPGTVKTVKTEHCLLRITVKFEQNIKYQLFYLHYHANFICLFRIPSFPNSEHHFLSASLKIVLSNPNISEHIQTRKVQLQSEASCYTRTQPVTQGRLSRVIKAYNFD